MGHSFEHLGPKQPRHLNVEEHQLGLQRIDGSYGGRSMVQVEGLVIGIASWALAIPLSVPMSLILGQAFGRIMMPVRTVTLIAEPVAVLLWLVVVVVVSVAACAWPAVRAMRVTTAAALAYEELHHAPSFGTVLPGIPAPKRQASTASVRRAPAHRVARSASGPTSALICSPTA